MKDFLKFMFASMLGTLLVGVLLIFLFIGFIAAMSASFAMQGKPAKVKEDSVLHIRLDQEMRDRGTADDLMFDFGPFKGMSPLGLNQVLAALEHAKTDDRIKGVFMELSMTNMGMATAREIREKLVEFKEASGKPVLAYAEYYTQGSYYLASAADEVYLVPEGDLDFRGLRAELMFFKGLFKKLDIGMEFIKGSNNIYKSFGEAYTEEKMTEANREQLSTLIEGLWQDYLNTISASRKVDVAKLRDIADNLRIRRAQHAMDLGLVDGVEYKDVVLDRLRERMGLGAGKEIRLAPLPRYARTVEPTRKGGRVAVVYAEGSIMSGENEDGTIGSETLSEAIRKAREDSAVKAIVLRVNSPGGSGLASDVIWREMVLAKAAKPVVVSMGDVAASGGYYISCAADKIYADPGTITGSIGVFGIIPNFQGFFNNKLGITFDGVKTGRYADLMSVNRPMRPDEREIIQAWVDTFYSDFLKRVAEGRNMPAEQVNEVGRGRVWTGSDAKRIGLVDELGGLEDAVRDAAERAGLGDAYRVVEYPEQKNFLQQLQESLNAQANAWVVQRTLGSDAELVRTLQQVRELRRSAGVQARMPFDLAIY
ncbi:MAG: signal peptide peptidase SppA [Flavobacteriales bacterium]|nr:signal peptide peptidase SppA [Flavobacteriales bacterium]